MKDGRQEQIEGSICRMWPTRPQQYLRTQKAKVEPLKQKSISFRWKGTVELSVSHRTPHLIQTIHELLLCGSQSRRHPGLSPYTASEYMGLIHRPHQSITTLLRFNRHNTGRMLIHVMFFYLVLP